MNAIDLLVEMQRKGDENHTELVRVVTAGFSDVKASMSTHVLDDTKAFAALDKRLAPLESTRKAIIWLVGAVVVQLLTIGCTVLAHSKGWIS